MSKFGQEHVRAMGRLGLEEVRAALYPSSNIAQPTEYGIYGSKTPGEVAEARRDETLLGDPNAQTGTTPATPDAERAERSPLHNALDRANRSQSAEQRTRDMDADR